MFECSGDEQFFYDWLNEGAMHNGDIHFIYNEVEIADIFQFWDCFLLEDRGRYEYRNFFDGNDHISFTWYYQEK